MTKNFVPLIKGSVDVNIIINANKLQVICSGELCAYVLNQNF